MNHSGALCVVIEQGGSQNGLSDAFAADSLHRRWSVTEIGRLEEISLENSSSTLYNFEVTLVPCGTRGKSRQIHSSWESTAR